MPPADEGEQCQQRRPTGSGANYTHGAILHRASVIHLSFWVAVSIMERAGALCHRNGFLTRWGGIARADRLPHKARDRHGGIAAGASLRLNP